MKRKIFLTVVMILIVSLMVSIFVACDEIFKKNDEREAKQVVATITYDGLTEEITRQQLLSSFNAYAPSYVQYYSMTYEQAADYILSSLAQRELLILYCKRSLEKLNELNADASGTAKYVTNKEYIDAVAKVNKDFQSLLETQIKDLIEEDEANAGSVDTIDSGIYEHEKITKANKDNVIRVTFDSDGGTTVDTQKILKGEAADRPTNPTKSGYTFMGWYEVEEGVVSDTLYPFGASAKLENSISLKAKWVKSRPARAEKTKEEEQETNYDYSSYTTEADLKAAATFADAQAAVKFTADSYKATAKANAQEKLELTDEDINKYFDKALKQLYTNLEKNYVDYEYYLNNELKSLVMTRYQRLLGYGVVVSAEEVQEEYNRIVEGNIEKYGSKDSQYETAIKGTLAEAIYQNYSHNADTDKQDSYGFVINILLKLGDDEVKELTDMVSDGTYSKQQILDRRNELVQGIKVAISNPNYSSTAECEHYTEEIKNYVKYDPQTNPNHECTCLNPDHSHDYTEDNDYNNMITFGEEDGEWKIIYNVKECETMPYIHDTLDEGNILYLPAFSDGTNVGVVDQIYNSFKAIDDAVVAGNITQVQSIYWKREMAKAWLYMVGDDTGGTSSDSNNGGLGYLVPAEESSIASSYITDFTNFARDLIAKGAGSYSTDGTLDGSYVIADSFIESGSTSGYSGIFMILTSHVAYDESAYTFEDATGAKIDTEAKAIVDTTIANLPLNYVVTYDVDLTKCKTIYDVIYNKLLDGKKYDKYSMEVNKFGEQNIDTAITYYKKAYKSMWSGLDKK